MTPILEVQIEYDSRRADSSSLSYDKSEDKKPSIQVIIPEEGTIRSTHIGSPPSDPADPRSDPATGPVGLQTVPSCRTTAGSPRPATSSIGSRTSRGRRGRGRSGSPWPQSRSPRTFRRSCAGRRADRRGTVKKGSFYKCSDIKEQIYLAFNEETIGRYCMKNETKQGC